MQSRMNAWSNNFLRRQHRSSSAHDMLFEMFSFYCICTSSVWPAKILLHLSPNFYLFLIFADLAWHASTTSQAQWSRQDAANWQRHTEAVHSCPEPRCVAQWAVIHGHQRSAVCEDLLLPPAADPPTASPRRLWDILHARHALVLSLFASSSKLTIKRLQCVQDAAARLLCNVSPHAYTSPLRRLLHWLPVSSRIQYKLCTIMFDVQHGRATDYGQLREATSKFVTISNLPQEPFQ